jgi:hypothetical protein
MFEIEYVAVRDTGEPQVVEKILYILMEAARPSPIFSR